VAAVPKGAAALRLCALAPTVATAVSVFENFAIDLREKHSTEEKSFELP
jgi:hypothetical protein